jgi:parvulin-like peptidyl-prolyl isomerase
MKNIRHLLVSLLAAVLTVPGQCADQSAISAAASAKPAKASGLFDETIIAKGKGLEIKRGQLDAEFIRAKTAYTSHGQVAPPDLERQVLDNLIGFNLILTKATDKDKVAGKELFTKNLQKVKEDAKLSESEFNDRLNRQLLLQDLTKEQWEKQNTDQATVQVTLERELNVHITDPDVKKFYDENPAKFEEQEKVRASHILLSTRDRATSTELSEEQKAAKRKTAEELVKRARAGEDFAKLAKEYSEDPGSKDKGGEYTFPRGQMVPEFEAAAFSLKPNEVSDVVTTQFGYHIIKLSEKIPAKKQELSEVAPRVKEFLTQQAIQKAVPTYVTKLKEEAHVEILDDKLKASSDNLGLPTGHPAATPAGKSVSK